MSRISPFTTRPLTSDPDPVPDSDPAQSTVIPAPEPIDEPRDEPRDQPVRTTTFPVQATPLTPTFESEEDVCCFNMRRRIQKLRCKVKCAAICLILWLGGMVAIGGTAAVRIQHARSAWVETAAYVLVAQNTARPCCTIEDCTCGTDFTNAASCTSFLMMFQEGPCGNGYACCSTRCDTCYNTCKSRNRGSKEYPCDPYVCNCVCSRSVSNDACRVDCGTCYTPTVFLRVLASDDTEILFNKSVSCGRDDVTCAAHFLAAWPNGSSHRAFYDRANPRGTLIVGDAPGNENEFKVSGYEIVGFLSLSIVFMIIVVWICLELACLTQYSVETERRMIEQYGRVI